MPERDRDALADTVAPEPTDLGSQPTMAVPSSGTGTAARVTRSIAPGDDVDREVDLPLVDGDLYTTADEIARGGMGRIVAATDRRLGRPVALKELLAPGPEAAARFRREALITARLQHPAIVPVYEAGRWPSGEPFYAMKLVAGKPLDRVVAGCRTLESRLALLPSVIAVCDAIAYAHSQRIVHRDLKPANVLIGDFGETVVIDWGLAKDLDAAPSEADATASDLRRGGAAPAPAAHLDTDIRPGSTVREGGTLTLAGAVMGTPAYMPPEQARGDVVDERADVFSLGAMLYHVLAGSPPYDARGATDVIAAAIAGKVVPLRERAATAPADLIAIVERAMQPEPEDRYPSARELAEELRRFQTGQMVGAHRYTRRERLVRFVRRHRAAVTIGAIAIAGFAIGGSLAIAKIVKERDRAEEQRVLAERRREAAEKLVDFMTSDMRDRLAEVGQLAVMAGLGQHVTDYYASLSDLPGGMQDADVDRMASALDILGEAERDKGALDDALARFDDARTRLRALIARDPDSADTPKRQGAIAHATVLTGEILQARGKTDDALAAYRDAVSTYDDALRRDAQSIELLRGEADAHDRIGDLERNGGKTDDAVDDYGRARQLRQDALDLGSDPATTLDVRFDLATSEMKLGSAEQVRGATAAAVAHYRASVAGREAVAAAAPDKLEYAHGLAYVRTVLAAMLRETGALPEAKASYEAALVTLDALVKKDPDNTGWRRDRGNAEADLGLVLSDLGDLDGAIARYQQSLDNHAVLIARDPQNSQWQSDVSRTDLRSGDARLSKGDVAGAIAAYRDALAVRQALVDRNPTNTPFRRQLAWAHHKLALGLPYAGDSPQAIDEAEQALQIRQQLFAESPTLAEVANELALSEFALGRLDFHAGKNRDALAHLDRAVERGVALVAADPTDLEWQESLTSAYVVRVDARLAAGDVDGATADAKAALDLSNAVIAKLPDSPSWRDNLAEAHWAAAEVLAKDPARAKTLGPRADHVQAARTILDQLDAEHHLGFEKQKLKATVDAAH